MVDINLLGEEESSEDRQSEESFAKTVSLDEPYKKMDDDVSSYTKQEPMESKSFGRESAAPSFSRRPAEAYSGNEGSSRTKAYFIVLGLILMALTAVFFLFPHDRKKKDDLTVNKPPVETIEEPMSSAPLDTSDLGVATETPGTTEQPLATTETPAATPATREPDLSATLSPLERQQLSSTKLAVTTVRALANSLSGANDFTLITYHGNHRFFAEFRSSSPQEASNVADMLRQKAGAVDAKTVSQSEMSANGGTLNKALVKGEMDPQAGGIILSGALNQMSASDFAEWLKQQSEGNNLSLKRLATGAGSGEGTPIQVHLAGANSDVMAFLSALENANINVSVYKIIVSPSDRKSLSTDYLDLVMQFEM
ncbi:hypothetical protein HUU05_27495 [candidate division KSB1 bacterium]|nr:hypothetical protein [candidate division KSB1 bacterium]